jgi:hypothetical protein
VFFTQQSVEKRLIGLWERRFFIAPKGSSGNLAIATEGGIPVSPLSGSTDRTECEAGLAVEVVLIAR